MHLVYLAVFITGYGLRVYTENEQLMKALNVPGFLASSPYRASTCSGSPVASTNSGTLVCMR